MEEDNNDKSQPMLELEPPTLRKTHHHHGGGGRRRRRRSSARFLRLTGRLMEDIEEEVEDDNEEDHVESEQHLGDMYKKAIRMNAENRINATNSWNFRLIENIDKFLEEEEETTVSSPDSSRSSSSSSSPKLSSTSNNEENVDPNVEGAGRRGGRKRDKRVNFTKASCTLDASVKIYSYRVDDVHLTSYKVLANLNRTDSTSTGGKNNSSKQQSNKDGSQQTQGENGEMLPGLEDDDEEGTNKSSSNGNGGTLETNLGTL